jgi:hypothetical protein
VPKVCELTWKPAIWTTSFASVPLAVPLPYVTSNAWPVLVKEDEDEESNAWMPLQAEDMHPELMRKRSEEPESRMTLYATGGVPIAIVP